VNIEVQSTAEALDQSYGTRLRIGFFKARLVQKVRSDRAVNDTQHFSHYGWLTGEQ